MSDTKALEIIKQRNKGIREIIKMLKHMRTKFNEVLRLLSINKVAESRIYSAFQTFSTALDNLISTLESEIL